MIIRKKPEIVDIRKRSGLRNYQVGAIRFAKEKKKCCLFLKTGAGKTVTSLTIAKDLLKTGEIKKVLILAPLRVAESTWVTEPKIWEHLKDFKVSICTGSKAKRKERLLCKEAEIYVINFENFASIVQDGLPWQWDMSIVDESSKLKNSSTTIWKNFKKIKDKLKLLLMLTGTPCSNSLMDLWAQIYLVDNGERLGRTITEYRCRYFYQLPHNKFKYIPYHWAQKAIFEKIKDICYVIGDDSLEAFLTKKTTTIVRIDLPPNAQKAYNSMMKDNVVHVDGQAIAAEIGTVKQQKLMQIENGFIYNDGVAHRIHTAKTEALRQIVADNPGQNILVAYQYKADLEELQEAFKHAVVFRGNDELERWNRREVEMMLIQPKSAAHGLNAQYGGNILVWYGLYWSLEDYHQLNARLHRQGQVNDVEIYCIIAKGKIGEIVVSVLESKNVTQETLLNSIKEEVARQERELISGGIK